MVWSPLAVQARRWAEEAVGRWGAEPLVMFGDEVKAPDLLALLSTPPLVGPARAILVRHAERLGQGGWRALVEGLALYPPSASGNHLVLLDESVEGVVARWVEETRGSPGVPALVRMESQGAAAGRAWFEQELASRGLHLPPPARRFVQAALEAHPERLGTELDKLQTYGGEGLDEPTLRRLLSRDLVEAAEPVGGAASGAGEPPGDRRRFQLAEAALSGEATRAMNLWMALRREGVPAAWVWREIGRQAMQLWAVAEVMERRFGPPAAWPPRVSPAVGPGSLPPAAARRQLACARRFGTAGLLRVLEWAAAADHASKRGGRDADEVLEGLLARLATFPGPEGRRFAPAGH